MKLNSKRSETESGTQRGIRDQNDLSIGSKLEPFMKLNSKRRETESGTHAAAYVTKMIRVSARNLSHSCTVTEFET